MPISVVPDRFTASTIAPYRYPAGAAGTISIVTNAMFLRIWSLREADTM